MTSYLRAQLAASSAFSSHACQLLRKRHRVGSEAASSAAAGYGCLRINTSQWLHSIMGNEKKHFGHQSFPPYFEIIATSLIEFLEHLFFFFVINCVLWVFCWLKQPFKKIKLSRVKLRKAASAILFICQIKTRIRTHKLQPFKASPWKQVGNRIGRRRESGCVYT